MTGLVTPKGGLPSANCQGWPYLWELGYWVKLLLDSCGITQPRYNRFRAIIGLKPCRKCPQRESAMNDAGWKVRDYWQKLRALFTRKAL
jgi:hypothetical protein